ncbi:probable pseudouridine-5'-phosphatase [Hyposmocoma kahamanoa]|uniref:probable pseudouridine-5'-phosphatase n=1 Tax=Hyposmocoma kahamanoa TaxID=1477025 RepID=UPI000E6D60E6|nr:probable pseudouridine-5'-phosphatase [Hyposmocoma kahamanoa]
MSPTLEIIFETTCVRRVHRDRMLRDLVRTAVLETHYFCYQSPGAERLIRHLDKTKVPFALATSSSERSVKTKVAAHKELFDLFHHKVMGSTDPEVKFGKPHPDIFLVAAARFPDKPEPSKCLVFEDSPHGVTAGIKAGMQVVMVPDPHLDKRLTTHATIVLPTLAKFQPEMFGLPAFQ